jgi:hypothetical protein
MRYFKDPMERTLYSRVLQDQTIYRGGENCSKRRTAVGLAFIAAESRFLGRRACAGFFREHPGLYTALPYLQENQKLVCLSYDTLKSLHKTLLQKLDPNSKSNKKENMQPNTFWSSNLELDMYAKWNKQIRSRGEFGNSKKIRITR